MTVQKITEAIKPLEQVAKINEIIDNLGQGGSVLMTGGNAPKYDDGKSVSSPYTVESDGWIFWGANVAQGPNYLYVNGNEVAWVGAFGQEDTTAVTTPIPVSEGDVVSWDLGDCKFYPRSDYDSLGNRYLGTLIKSLLPIEDSSLHLLDGAKLEYTGIYKNFIDSISDLYESGEKKSKIEKIGNLVDNNGIISNFSVSNYGVIPVLNSKLALASSWEIGGKFNVLDFTNVPSGGACIFANNFGASSNRSIYIIASTHSSIAVFLSESGGTTWDIADNEDDFNINNLTANTDYWYRLKYTGSSYILELSTDGITYSQTKTLNKSAHIYSEDANLFLGDNHTGSMYFPGSIDLNACYVNIEGQRYWTGREVSWATSELKWQESISTCGSCGRFVYDSVNQTVRLPKVSDIIQGTSDVNALGELTEAGVPNITGQVGTSDNASYYPSGAFYPSASSGHGNGSGGSITVSMDASRSSSVYGKSDTVQPQTIKALYYMVVATGSREEVKLNFNAKAESDFSNIASTAKNISTWSSNITNSITEIPQDVKLEISGEYIVIKSGSKLTFPDGFELDGVTKKFTTITLTSDHSISTASAAATREGWGLWCTKSESTGELISGGRNSLLNDVYVQTTAPTESQYMMWYNPSTNLIKATNDQGQTWNNTRFSLPVCEFTRGDVGYVSTIDKVFNGFGYFGSIDYILPGVKCVMPDGRNEDGTLKNISFIVPNVVLDNFSQFSGEDTITYLAISDQSPYFMRHARYVETNKNPNTTYTLWYNTETNEMLYTLNDTTSHSDKHFCYVCEIDRVSGQVIPMDSPLPFKAVNYNELHGAEAVVETYASGTSWYRIWSDGWCEQGGRASVRNDGETTVTLLVEMKDANYYANWISCSGGQMAGEGTRAADNLTTTTFRLYNGQDATMVANWKVEGYSK